MEPRLNFYKTGPEAIKTLAGLEQRIAKSALEKPLVNSSACGPRRSMAAHTA